MEDKENSLGTKKTLLSDVAYFIETINNEPD